MTAFSYLLDQAPLQDRDLLQRLSLYFDAVDSRLRQGEGWFIFNAEPARSRRITAYIDARVAEHPREISYLNLPWRDFALSAYVADVGLPALAPEVQASRRAKQEFDLAARVTWQTWTRVVSSDLLLLVGLKPAHRREAELLDRAMEQRHAQRRATIVMTPEMPRELQAEFSEVDPTDSLWSRFFERMYETSLVAL